MATRQHTVATISDAAVPYALEGLAKLYNHKYLAPSREYLTNAIDAHLQAGVTDPIEVTVDLRGLRVRDYGSGMTPETLNGRVVSMDVSGKKGEELTTGKFGIGTKSGFIISDNLVIRTRTDDGVTTVLDATSSIDAGFTATLNRYEPGEAHVTLIGFTGRGTEVFVPVDFDVHTSGAYHQMLEMALSVAELSPVPVIVRGIDSRYPSDEDDITQLYPTADHARDELINTFLRNKGITCARVLRHRPYEENTGVVGTNPMQISGFRRRGEQYADMVPHYTEEQVTYSRTREFADINTDTLNPVDSRDEGLGVLTDHARKVIDRYIARGIELTETDEAILDYLESKLIRETVIERAGSWLISVVKRDGNAFASADKVESTSARIAAVLLYPNNLPGHVADYVYSSKRAVKHALTEIRSANTPESYGKKAGVITLALPDTQESLRALNMLRRNGPTSVHRMDPATIKERAARYADVSANAAPKKAKTYPFWKTTAAELREHLIDVTEQAVIDGADLTQNVPYAEARIGEQVEFTLAQFKTTDLRVMAVAESGRTFEKYLGRIETLRAMDGNTEILIWHGNGYDANSRRIEDVIDDAETTPSWIDSDGERAKRIGKWIAEQDTHARELRACLRDLPVDHYNIPGAPTIAAATDAILIAADTLGVTIKPEVIDTAAHLTVLAGPGRGRDITAHTLANLLTSTMKIRTALREEADGKGTEYAQTMKEAGVHRERIRRLHTAIRQGMVEVFEG